MSKMNAIHQELTELGSAKIREIEDFAISNMNDLFISDLVAVAYNINVHTAIVIVAGAARHTESTSMQKQEMECQTMK